MKTNPALTDFLPTMVDACRAALDSGIFYDHEFSDFVLRQLGGYGCEGVLMEIAELDAAAENYAALQRAQRSRLEAAVSAAPRGHYALIRTATANGCHMYKAIASDGYGNGVATGGAYDIYDSIPPKDKFLERMIGYEIYLCRKAVEQERARQTGREALAKYGFHIGMSIKDIEIGGEKFSSGTVSEVHPENGCVTLYLARRGSRNRWKSTLSAEYVGQVTFGLRERQSTPSDVIASSEDCAQRSLFS